MRNALAVSAIVAFNALPVLGVALFGWSEFIALTLICADLMMLTMIGAAHWFASAAPTPHPKLARVTVAGILVIFTAAVLAMSGDRWQSEFDLGGVLARSELGVTLLLLAVARLAQYAITVAISPRAWKPSTLAAPLFGVALLVWFWRPEGVLIFAVLAALCIVKLVSEVLSHYADAAADRESTWMARASKRFRRA